MNKKILVIIVSIILAGITLGVAMAETVYAGNSHSFLSEEFEYYTVIGNSSNMEGMNISWENGNTTINFAYNYAPDNFTLIFFNLEKEIITEHHYSSGGGTKYVDRNVTEYVEVPNYIDREVEVIKEIQSEPEIIKEKESVWIKIIYILGGFLIGFWSIIIVMKLILRSKRRNEVRNDSQLV